MSRIKAILALEDGTTFSGTGIGAPGAAVGEVVFNTAMTGYQEIITDPSYLGQLVILTASHVGNTGTNEQDIESAGPRAAGLIVRHCPRRHSSWRATESLPDYLIRHRRVAIADVDTRALTVLLREKGAQNGCILAGDDPDPEEALARARACPAMTGQDLAGGVSCTETHAWHDGLARLPASREPATPDARLHVVCMDFGVKRNILRLLVETGCRVTVVPANTDARTILDMSPDGVLLSNGPGDPGPVAYGIEAVRGLLDAGVPILGICLGHQLLALAAGARTVKMKFGHHGANHPVVDTADGRVAITSQNHGFAVDETSLPTNVEATHRSLFDGSLQGIRLTDRPAFSFQGHPEASPGPHDLRGLFLKFVAVMAAGITGESVSGLGTRDSGLAESGTGAGKSRDAPGSGRE